MNKKVLVIALVFLALTAFPASQGANAESLGFSKKVVHKLDIEIAKQMQEMKLPGIAVVISVPGEGEYIFVKGKANLETGRARNINDQFRIGSITKTFTATALLQLIDQGKLSKSDTLSKWYPDFPNAEKITIYDLLSMRSGIFDSADEQLLTDYYNNPLIDLSAKDMITLAAGKADHFEPPGQKSIYTNVNYSLLEEIVRKVSGKNLGDQIFEIILKPLGMTSTLYPVSSELPGNLHGYSWNPQKGRFEDKTILNPALAGGAGAMISTMSDLKLYAKALCVGSLLKSETQKSRLETKHLEGTPEFVAYGEGITRIGSFYGHNGTIFGFSSEMWYLPEKDAVILISVNRLDEDDKSKASNLFFALTKEVFPEYVNW
jgi:D-alanyl-D-alanine carboxypeptidase